jgi:hypothetical protein
MSDWLFWTLYIGVPLLVLLGLGALSVWCISIVLKHYS